MSQASAEDLAFLSLIEPAAALCQDNELVLERGWSRELVAKFARHSSSRPVANLILRDVVIDPQTGIIFQNGAVLEWANYPARPGEEAAARQRAAQAVTAPADRLAYYGFNREWRNHYHWLTQSLPAIAGYSATPGWAEGVLLLPPINANQVRSLELAGIRTPQIIALDPSRAIAVERLVFSALLGHRYVPSPFCRALYERIVTNAADLPVAQKSAIYISRADSANRPMRNEDDLLTLMRARGIVPVVMSELSMDEQIALFRQARLVVGPHGAGLSNIVFCRPGARLFELFPEHWVTPDLKVLAQQMQVHYWAQAHRSHGTFREFRHQVPWTVDLSRVERRLDEMNEAAALAECAA